MPMPYRYSEYGLHGTVTDCAMWTAIWIAGIWLVCCSGAVVHDKPRTGVVTSLRHVFGHTLHNSGIT